MGMVSVVSQKVCVNTKPRKGAKLVAWLGWLGSALGSARLSLARPGLALIGSFRLDSVRLGQMIKKLKKEGHKIIKQVEDQKILKHWIKQRK